MSWIITADDLGFSPWVNEAVALLAARGKITATSWMANMPFEPEVFPEIEVGLHFCLTSGRPCARGEVPLLTNADGCFCHGFAGLWRKSGNREFLQQVEHELDAQWNHAAGRLAKWGRQLTHLDSHQHIHAIPGIFEIVAKKAAEEKVRLRIPAERIGSWSRFFGRFPTWFPVGLAKGMLLTWCLRNIPDSWRLRDYVGVMDSGKMGEKAWRAIEKTWRREMPLEINLHPATRLDVERYRFEIGCSEADLRFWSSPWRKIELETLLKSEES
ncbi:MAG: ChbG/HpnK family deacetylase [Planctomycetia bacterium]|nr:ChbG/HpnK family deacetylase [Planctomycetia bacterium]